MLLFSNTKMFLVGSLYVLSLLFVGWTNFASAQQYTEDQCIPGLLALNFNLTAFEKYGTHYYAEDSVYALAQAGTYYGPEDIAEYVRLGAGQESPYVSNLVFSYEKFAMSGFDPVNGTCTMLHMVTKNFTTNPENARGSTFLSADMAKISYELSTGRFSSVYLYVDSPQRDFFFGNVLNTPQTREYICGVMMESCPETHELNGSPTLQECVDRLAELPAMTDDYRMDGNSQSCRAVHAFLASRQDKHCPHISFVPQEDPDGKIKCQNSDNPQGQLDTGDLFTPEELKMFQDFKDEEASLVDPITGFALLEIDDDDDMNNDNEMAGTSSAGHQALTGVCKHIFPWIAAAALGLLLK